MVVYLLVIGLVSILGQVVILRELSVAFFGVELIYILAIGIWLMGSAAGALLGRRDYIPRHGVLRWTLVGLAVLLPLEIVFIRSIRVLFAGVPGAYLPLQQQFGAILLGLLPVAGLLGLLFQWAAKNFIDPVRSLALAYAIESAGGVLGGLLSTLLLALGFQNFTLGVLCSLLLLAVVILRTGLSWKSRLAVAVPGILMVGMFYESPRIDAYLTGISHPDLVVSRDSPYSRITITQSASQSVVFENDVLVFETGSVAAEELVHAAAVQSERMQRVLLLGGTSGGYLTEVLKHPVEEVDLVELNAVLLDSARQFLPDRFQRDFTDPRVHFHLEDPRRFLGRGERYDWILVGMPDPDSGMSNRFYTREFFELCRDSLQEQGLLALKLSSSQNVLTRLSLYRVASIYHALRAEFRDVQILPGLSHVILAADQELERDPETLGRKWRDMGIEARLFSSQYLHYLYTNDRFGEIQTLMERSSVPQNTDSRPICYPFAGLIWLSRFFPSLANFQPGRLGAGVVPAALVIFLIGALAFWLSRGRWRFAALVFSAGFLGMILESIILLQYQTRSGVLYQNIGLLLTLFMCGLAVGGWHIHRVASSAGALASSWGMVIFSGFVLVSLSVLTLQYLGFSHNIGVASALLFSVGFLVACAFGYGGFRGNRDQRQGVSPLYAADLAGGCLGSLLASLLFIPFWGIAYSALLVAGLAVLVLILA